MDDPSFVATQVTQLGYDASVADVTGWAPDRYTFAKALDASEAEITHRLVRRVEPHTP